MALGMAVGNSVLVARSRVRVWMERESSETERLLAEEAERQRRERHAAEEATEPAAERAATRRADKAAYLKRKLHEREESER